MPPELQEKDFIQPGFRKNPWPLWLWLFLATTLAAVLWGAGSYFTEIIKTRVESSPFLQVTNREMSLFLWQFPEYMRVNVKNKTGYLPDFEYEKKIGLDPYAADNFVTAPPELLFLYHTWKRLISQEFTARSIELPEFQQFLEYSPEWQPAYWSAAPKDYVALVEKLSSLKELPNKSLPIEVKMAFQGWKNFFKEGEAINNVAPTWAQMQGFIKTHPHYARNYWRNIVMQQTPKYLQILTFGKPVADAEVPAEELSPFLKVALYNSIQH